MQARLDGKIVLVTGGAQGVGRGIALEAAASGAAGVMLTDRNAAMGARAAAEIEALGVAAGFVAVDLIEDEAPARIAGACVDRFGRIDALVNAAARTDRATLLNADLALWDALFRINARAPFFLMQRAVADMRGRGAGGAIVNILSQNVHLGAPDLAIYSATKAALALATRNTAQAHRFDRVRVNGINIGWTNSPGERTMQGETLGKGEGWLAEAERKQPFGRLVTPEDIGRLAAFLLSDASIPMTGAIIDQEQWVAGGREF